MSLLLEALKKAELAKQRATYAEEAKGNEAPAERKAVMTREKLPDISQPVEILTDDLPSAGQKTAPKQSAAAPQEPLELMPAPTPDPRPVAQPSDRDAAESRDAARRLFEVKEMEYNPKRPFYLTLTALGVVALAYGGYVWWQLQPKSSYNAQAIQASQAQSAAERTKVAPIAQPLPAIATAAAPAATAPPAMQAVPAVPSSAAVASALAPPTRSASSPAPRRAATLPPMAAPVVPALGPVATMAPSRAAGEYAVSNPDSIAIKPASLQIDPQLERAYDAVQRNELAAAREIYQSLLQRDQNNRDALLGMAAIDVKTRSFELAEARYLRLLELDPRDSYAQAGLLALRGQMDPVSSESRIKNLLASQPESTHLYFALGNQYALQSRWGEAQQAYFRAFAADPENADYAFNLAVSLDHLRQNAPALDYYRRSLTLADKRPGSFDRTLATARIRELQK